MKHVRLIGVLVLIAANTAMACRYTVRDIGFVRLGAPVVTLLVFDTDQLGAIVATTEDLPLDVEAYSAASEFNTPAVEQARTDGAVAVLVDAKGRTHALAEPERLGNTPLARLLADEAFDRFAHVLLLESPNKEANRLAREEQENLQARLKAIEPHLPRPISHPLQLVQLSAEQQQVEHALLWSLGIEGAVDQPTLLVVYGRARRAGAPVTMTAETRDEAVGELSAQLALVGESCECETSRAWTAEPRGLIPWTDDTHDAAAESLGFDPESPIVRAEVRRILGRSPSDTNNTPPRPESLEQLLLGYGETVLEPIAVATNNQATSGNDEQTPPPPRTELINAATAGASDDWSFNEPSTIDTSVQKDRSNFPLVITLGTLFLVSLLATIVVLRKGPAGA